MILASAADDKESRLCELPWSKLRALAPRFRRRHSRFVNGNRSFFRGLIHARCSQAPVYLPLLWPVC
jgi:hypothetical protein